MTVTFTPPCGVFPDLAAAVANCDRTTAKTAIALHSDTANRPSRLARLNRICSCYFCTAEQKCHEQPLQNQAKANAPAQAGAMRWLGNR